MALSVATVWEVRTTGAADNGGGFVAGTGTDYSQQDAAQLSLTDLASPDDPFVTSVIGGFTAGMVGNLIYITGGGATAGFYAILSYDSANQVSLDRSPGIVVGGSGKVGGAQLNLTTVLAAVPAASASGANTIWIKAGTYVAGTHFTNQVKFAAAGHWLKHHRMIGYNTTRGDATAPCVTFDANNGAYDAYYSDKTCIRLEYITATGRVGSAPTNAKSGFYCATGSSVNTFYRCRSTNTGYYGFYASDGGATCIGCEADNWGKVAGTIYGFYLSAAASVALGCYAHDGTGSGFYSVGYGPVLVNCIADTCTGYGFYQTTTSIVYQLLFSGCVAYNNTLGGVRLDNATANRTLILNNCIITGNGGYGISSNAVGGRVELLGCAFYGNSSGDIDANTTVQETVTRVTLTGNPFVDAANGDFSLNDAALQVHGTGWPGAFLSAGVLTAWAGHPDFGAVQRMYPETITTIAPAIARGETRLLLSDVLNSRSAILDVTPFSYGVISASMIGGIWALGRITPEYSLDGVNWAALGSALSAAGYTRPVDLRGVRYLSFRLSTVQAGYAEVDLDVWADDSSPDMVVY